MAQDSRELINDLLYKINHDDMMMSTAVNMVNKWYLGSAFKPSHDSAIYYMYYKYNKDCNIFFVFNTCIWLPFSKLLIWAQVQGTCTSTSCKSIDTVEDVNFVQVIMQRAGCNLANCANNVELSMVWFPMRDMCNSLFLSHMFFWSRGIQEANTFIDDVLSAPYTSIILHRI